MHNARCQANQARERCRWQMSRGLPDVTSPPAIFSFFDASGHTSKKHLCFMACSRPLSHAGRSFSPKEGRWIFKQNDEYMSKAHRRLQSWTRRLVPAEILGKTSVNMHHHPTKVTRTTSIMEPSLIEPINESFLFRKLRKRQLQLYAVIKKMACASQDVELPKPKVGLTNKNRSKGCSAESRARYILSVSLARSCEICFVASVGSGNVTQHHVQLLRIEMSSSIRVRMARVHQVGAKWSSLKDGA